MTAEMWLTVAIAFLTMAGGVFGFLIRDLYTKHDIDAEKLVDLRSLVESTRYTKTEVDTAIMNLTHYLDRRFDRIEEAIKK